AIKVLIADLVLVESGRNELEHRDKLAKYEYFVPTCLDFVDEFAEGSQLAAIVCRKFFRQSKETWITRGLAELREARKDVELALRDTEPFHFSQYVCPDFT